MLDLNMFNLLPPNVVTHFEPYPQFCDWFADYAGERVTIEVGAGQCVFSKALVKRGVKLVAVEPRPNEEVHRECVNFLLPMPAQRVSLLREPDKLIVVARPDHSGWVSDLTYMIHPDSELIYIGLDKNLEIDLPRSKLEELYTGAGEDGEVVFRVK
jgi:hypothetical protein